MTLSERVGWPSVAITRSRAGVAVGRGETAAWINRHEALPGLVLAERLAAERDAIMADGAGSEPNVPQRIRAWSAALYPTCCCTVSPAGPARGAVRTGRTVRHVRGRPVHDAVPTVPSTSRRRRPLDTTARAPSRRPVRWVGRYRPRTGVPWPAEVRPCPTPRGPPAERRAGRPHVRVGARLAYTYTQVLILVQQLATDHVSIRVMFQYES